MTNSRSCAYNPQPCTVPPTSCPWQPCCLWPGAAAALHGIKTWTGLGLHRAGLHSRGAGAIGGNFSPLGCQTAIQPAHYVEAVTFRWLPVTDPMQIRMPEGLIPMETALARTWQRQEIARRRGCNSVCWWIR